MNCDFQSEKVSQISTKSKSIFSSPDLVNVSTGQRIFRTLAPTTTSAFILESIQSSTQESRFQAPFKQGTPQFDRRLGPIEESIPIKTSRQVDSSQTDYEASQEASIQSLASQTSHSNKYRLGQFDIEEESDGQDQDQQDQDSYQQKSSQQRSNASNSVQLVLSNSQNQQHQLDISLKSRSLASDQEISAIEIQSVIPEQREIDIEAVEALISGFYVCKYGRQNRFNPDKRFLQLSPDLKLLVIRDCEFKIRKVFATDHISKIESGVKTENFKRFKIPFEAQSRCFSIYLPERTLDFQSMTFEEMHQIMNSISSLI